MFAGLTHLGTIAKRRDVWWMGLMLLAAWFTRKKFGINPKSPLM
jgi:hypothetical protein